MSKSIEDESHKQKVDKILSSYLNNEDIEVYSGVIDGKYTTIIKVNDEEYIVK